MNTEYLVRNMTSYAKRCKRDCLVSSLISGAAMCIFVAVVMIATN